MLSAHFPRSFFAHRIWKLCVQMLRKQSLHYEGSVLSFAVISETGFSFSGIVSLSRLGIMSSQRKPKIGIN